MKLGRIALLMAAIPLSGQETLNLKFDQPLEIKTGRGTVKFDGPFEKTRDGQCALAFGSKIIPGIPASELVGENGTIIFTFMTKAGKPENELRNRMIVTLRGNARERVYFYQAGSETLYFAFKNYTDPQTIRSVKPIEFNRWYQAACTWDGSTVKYFIDGVLQGECPQPYVPEFPAAASFLNFGAFIDNATNPASWGEDSCLIRDIKVYKSALTMEEIMAAAGVKGTDAGKQFLPFLTVPRVAAAPVMDGTLNDKIWQQASTMISLIDGGRPAESLSYRDNNPRFCHDGKNLYIGFQTVFPGDYKIIKGELRGSKEPEVWGNESFELYFSIGDRFYRFAGNAAGGYCESLDLNSKFNGRWQYKTTMAMRIDNCHIWQGEISIPFETLGITRPDEAEIKVNFCRTWRGLQHVGVTSLAGTENYGNKDSFVTLKLSNDDTAFQEVAINDPNYGALEQKIQFFSSKNASMGYAVTLLSSGGFSPGRLLMNKTINVKPDQIEKLDNLCIIESASYDRLLFQVKNLTSKKLLMQQVVPFKIVENYLDVVPAFSRSKIFMKPRYGLLKSKTGGNPVQMEVISPESKIIFSTVISSNEEFPVNFSRDNATGVYTAVIYSMVDGAKKVFTSKKFSYHGIGAWENNTAEERVLPPFEPLTVSGDAGSFDIGMRGRVYQYNNSLLPVTISSMKHSVSTAVSLLISGVEVKNPLTVKKSTPCRVELAGDSRAEKYDITQNSWIEYDGVMWNIIKFKAKENLAEIKLIIDIPDSIAKFYHATTSGFGSGGRRTEAVDKNIALSFWPVIWIGGHEQGICWFAESNAAWKTLDATPVKIIKNSNKTSLEIKFADKLDKDQDIVLEFGLVATPVRPLPGNYPLNVFGDSYGMQLNPAKPHAPVIAVSLQPDVLGAGFYDLPPDGPTPSIEMKKLLEGIKKGSDCNTTSIPYQAAILIPEEYAVVKDNIQEWQTVPECHQSYKSGGKDYKWYSTCPASEAANYYVYRFKELVKSAKLKGIYFDFGPAYTCCNRYHGCSGGYHILAKREFYKRIAGALADANNGEYALVVHNSESVQIPAFTFATHFLNGEGLRQMSSGVFHDGKDLLDNYTITDFASEHSSLPWGITSSIYCPADPLLPQFGGDKEGGAGTPQELYKFRMTKAVMAGSLIHNTIPSASRLHYGWFDKVVRFYDDFKVSQAEFMPYWRNSEYVSVLNGKDIYVSFYRHPDKKAILAVISHVSKEHLDQNVSVKFNPGRLGFKKFISAAELLTGPDPEYQRLYDSVPDTTAYSPCSRWRIPVKTGDFGVEFKGLENDIVKLNLKHHSVAIVKITGE